mgnify:CR=1 FL=1
MRLFKSWHGLVAAGAITLMATPALANEPTSKEQEMEQRIAELEAQLESVMTQMQTNSTSQTTLESQIAELQTSMADGDNGLSAYWKNGIRMDSADKNFKFKIGGRIQNDYAFFDANSDADDFYGSDEFNTGTEFRRARLYIAGTIYGNVGFKAEYDFAGGDADFKDVYIRTAVPFGTLTVGHQFQPFGLEEQTSSKYITFMERGLGSSTSPGRDTGVRIDHNWLPEGMRLSNGIFRTADSFGDDSPPNGAGEWAMGLRLSGDVMTEEEDDMLLAVGGSINQRKEKEQTNSVGLDDNLGMFRSRGGQHLGTYFIDTGMFAVDDDTLTFGLDAAWSMGQWHAQGEWSRANYSTKVGSDVDIDVYSVQVGYFLTGENRAWDAKKGNWGRTSPLNNYGDDSGDCQGAWEVAARYGSLDATDGSLRGGEIEQWTLGVNWYLNPNTRVMFNYVMSEVSRLNDGGIGYDPEVDTFQMRFQIDF